MGHTMWGFPIPSLFEENPIATGLLQMILSAVVSTSALKSNYAQMHTAVYKNFIFANLLILR